MRFSESWGTSWRGRQPGTRHWRSHRVSFGLFGWMLYSIAWLTWWLCIVPFLALLWLVAESVLLTGSILIAAVALWVSHASMQDVHVVRHGWFWLFETDLH